MSMTYEDYVIRGLEARQAGDATSWELGDLASGVETAWGEEKLQTYADDIGVAYNSLRAYRQVAEAYEKDIRMSNLGWHLHQVVASRSNRVQWLQKADKGGWTWRALAERVATHHYGARPMDGGYAAVVTTEPVTAAQVVAAKARDEADPWGIIEDDNKDDLFLSRIYEFEV